MHFRRRDHHTIVCVCVCPLWIAIFSGRLLFTSSAKLIVPHPNVLPFFPYFRSRPIMTSMTNLELMGGGELQVYRVDNRQNEQIVNRIHTEAKNALCGDNSCSSPNLSDSCFAIEICAKGYPKSTFDSIHLSSLTSHPYAFVVVAKYTDCAKTLTFVGCISADTASTALRAQFHPHLNSDSIVISNLCVAKAYRGRGAAKMLMGAIVRVLRSERGWHTPLFLVIMKHEKYRKQFERRVAMLRQIYKNFGFRECVAHEDGILLTLDAEDVGATT